MADKTDRYEENVKGAFYVDQTCIICRMCSEIAPELFQVAEDEDHSFVFKQPTNDEEQELALEAMEACPTESIGNDGDS